MDTTIETRATNGTVYVRMILVQVFWAGTFVASEIALHEQPPALTALVGTLVVLMVTENDFGLPPLHAWLGIEPIPFIWSTAVGLVLYGMRPEVIGGSPFASENDRAAREAVAGESLVNRITTRMKGWFDEL